MLRRLIRLAIVGGLLLGLVEGVAAGGAGAKGTTSCTTTVTSGAVVPPDTPTAVGVKSIPKCAKIPSTGVPVDIGSVLVAATIAGKKSLLVTSTSATSVAVAQGTEVNFIPAIPGSVVCTGFTGSVTFAPPLRNNAALVPKETFKGQATGCTVTLAESPTSSRAMPHSCFFCESFTDLVVSAVEASAGAPTLGLGTIALLGLSAADMTLAHTAFGIAFEPSHITLPDTHFVTASSGTLEWVLDAGPSTPTATGSFAGSYAAGTFSTNVTPSQLNAQAGGKVGVKSIKFVGGSISVG